MSLVFAHSAAGQDFDEKDLEHYAKIAERPNGLSLPANEFVIERINYWRVSEGRKKWLRSALKRMQEHETLILKKLEKHGLPSEFLYVPVVETSFRNKDWGTKYGAGIWSLMPTTAKSLGLVVSEENDERLDVEKATIAASRHLKNNFKRFRDWHLSLRAYNEGETRLARRMKRLKTRDPWQIEKLEPNHNSYVQNVIAIVVLARNPELLKK